MTIAFYTLGCKLNFAETSSLAAQAAVRGYSVVDFNSPADIYVINTCTVTAAAEKKCRQTISRAVRSGGRVAVVGCFAQLRPEEIKKIAGVTFVLGTDNKNKLFDLLEQKSETPTEEDSFIPVYSTTGRTRAFFKIQDGCNNFCTYCAVPYARGRSRSATIVRTIEVARKMAADGIKEAIFTGVNIGDFGHENGENLAGLIKELLRIDDIERYRISSIEPDLLTTEIIEMVANEKKLMPHFHIPLQSGSNDILADMHRHYKRELFAEKIAFIRNKIPDAFIAADVIVGFPTETVKLFNETYEFLQSLDISALHVFTYSPRPEAASSHIKPLNTAAERKDRSEKLHIFSQRKKEEFYKKFRGSKALVLWEGHEDNHGNTPQYMYGYTENYLRIRAPFDTAKINTVESVII
ncbi:MAG: tRNA (N(6)-L-threonylcarbamoyladenosine(37)-C(2))-methylthiotransferase MtaB [Bacteroidales bacterium]|jgi:threonylcarbamoyladenosine tRNA methylthiotransferase MtaB|nr:tRNA (N(6)-L-threonylcarbamoyladenosine(37)-C(2))-methylthiotransferase MtaB [Bacteroidales bacterium]